jgi:predicted anti-sigma-YlaC factor YlaD
MNPEAHDPEALGGLVVGGLDDVQRRALEAHLAECERCRDERDALVTTARALGELPPEAMLEGPPEHADLVLERALRQVRHESSRAARRQWVAAAVAAVVVIALAIGGGVALAGRDREPAPLASQPNTAPTPLPPPAGTRVASAHDTRTGARATVRVEPAAGWVRVEAAVSGIPAGERCRLWVVARDGARQLAGSWVVSDTGAREGTTLDGTAIVDPSRVDAIVVENVAGKRFVRVPV